MDRNARIFWASAIVFPLLVIFGICITVGGSGPRREYSSTKATLGVLRLLMNEYISDGNPPLIAEPNIDPTRAWVDALSRCSKTVGELNTLKGKQQNGTVLDAYGNPIRFVPADPDRKRGAFFQSAGPDGKMDTEDDYLSDPI